MGSGGLDCGIVRTRRIRRSRTTPLEHCGGDLLHLDKGKYQWIDVRRFRGNPELSDDELLAALLAHPQYHDDYQGLAPDEQPGTVHQLPDIRATAQHEWGWVVGSSGSTSSW